MQIAYYYKQIFIYFNCHFLYKLVKFIIMENGPSILKLSSDDEKKEFEFELDYLSSLTFEERLKMMREKSREMLKQMIEHGHRRAVEIIKRP
jgi:hypothetical protein